MRIVYDQVKNDRNILERALPFDEAKHFDLETASISDIFRNGEWRKLAVGYFRQPVARVVFYLQGRRVAGD